MAKIWKTKKETVSSIFTQLRLFLPEIESKSYFELNSKLRKLLTHFESPSSKFPQIEGWSFVPHPNVVKKLTEEGAPLKRFILTIDTLRSTIYNPVEEFLTQQSANINTYYTGGWADFLCDVYLDEDKFKDFLNELRQTLRDAGIGKFEEDPNKVMTVFEVLEPVIICQRPVKDLSNPSAEAIEKILAERAKFEVVYRNYRSKEAFQLFKSEKELKSYLNQLKKDGIIVCYSIVFDFPFGNIRDYVPMILGSDREAPIQKLLTDARKDSNLLKPVLELLKVKPIQTTDKAEEEVNYIFINEYEHPGEKKLWKKSIYEHTEIDVNLYNYPLEGVLNETPIYLSDLPELLKKLKAYETASKNGALFMGYPVHELLQNPQKFLLPAAGLARHGVTFGEPGSGKTNTDLVLACEAVESFKTVIVLDSSGGIQSKISELPDKCAKSLTQVKVTSADSNTIIPDILKKEGLIFLECSKKDAPDIVTQLITSIENLDDNTTGNKTRSLTGFLLIEEAGDALGLTLDQKKRNTSELNQLLTKSFRKGWAIWLSLQTPTQLGFDEESGSEMLAHLQNRIISFIKDKKAKEILFEAFDRDGTVEKEINNLRERISHLPIGSAFCRGISYSPTDGEKQLPLIETKIRLLGKD